MGKKPVARILLTIVATFAFIAGGCGREEQKKDQVTTIKKCAVMLERVRSVDPRNLPENEMIFDDMVRLPGGDVFLLDGKNVGMVKIDSSGKVAAEFLKKGEGPGEFGSYPKLQLLNGHMWVMGRKKIATFTLDGSLVKEYHLKRFYSSICLIDDSRFLAAEEDYAAGPNTSHEFTKYIGLFNLQSETLEQRYLDAANLGRLFVDVGRKAPMAVIPGPQVIPDLVFAFDFKNQEILISKTDDYQIQIMSLDGTHKSRISRPHTCAPLTNEGKQAVADGFGNIPQHIKQAVIESLPQTLPALHQINILENGNILVKRISGMDQTEVDILDKAGTLICSLELPLKPNTILYKIERGLLLTIEEEDDRNIYAEYKIKGLPALFSTP